MGRWFRRREEEDDDERVESFTEQSNNPELLAAEREVAEQPRDRDDGGW
jgi:hypothetical protein